MGVGVVRTDRQGLSDEAAGKFTAADRATLRLIHELVRKLAG
jgi:hypothetical protein